MSDKESKSEEVSKEEISEEKVEKSEEKVSEEAAKSEEPAAKSEEKKESTPKKTKKKSSTDGDAKKAADKAKKAADDAKEAADDAEDAAKDAKKAAKDAKKAVGDGEKKIEKATSDSKKKVKKVEKDAKDAVANVATTATSSTAGKDTGYPPIPQQSTTAEDNWAPYPKKKAPFYNVAPDGEIEIRPAKAGVASLKPCTVVELLKLAVAKKGDKVALRQEVNGEWKSWTWKQYYDEITQFAKSLVQLGFERHAAVNIIGFNSPQWFIANVGAIVAGGKAAGIYTTNQTEACQYITEHSEAEVVVVENEAQLNKFLPIRAELTNVKAYVIYNGDAVPKGVNKDKKLAKVYDWKGFLALGEKVTEKQIEKRMSDQKPGHCATLIYTSGTTGNPKAVMISHDNATWTPQTVFKCIGDGFGQAEEHVVSYLPLSHVAAQMVDIHMPIGVAATRPGNCIVHFARPDALKGSLKDTLNAARPTLFFGVPRVWEKFAEAIKAKGAQSGGIKKMLGSWAKGKALAVYEEGQMGRKGGKPFMAGMALGLLGAVRGALGLDRCKFQLTGAAPISAETLRYFGSLNIPIYELYGMSESTGPHTVSYPGHYLLGSCGPVLPGCEIKIDHEEGRDAKGEGEILFRGRHIMMGYMKNEEKTKETIDQEGWLHSGDVGKLDSFGFLHITGRIKELIITAGGENVAPVPMETAVKDLLPAISNIIMIGDKRKYNVSLVTLPCKPTDDGGFTTELMDIAKAIDPKCKTPADARESEAWKNYIESAIKKVNSEVAVSNASKIQKFYILDSDFSIPGGELTPTLKLKRPIVMKKYADEIEALYSDNSTAKKKGASTSKGDAKETSDEKKTDKKKSEKKEGTDEAAAKKKKTKTPEKKKEGEKKAEKKVEKKEEESNEDDDGSKEE
mmetsp:Transcript_8502/g.14678  ORF Transcript_8502/g.14678 Transcript_8502/m.14678 type:complete len:906 (+) Transcript_8502:132-2849(+)